ncbi:carbohydrate ABC transporter permease [Candidatus Hydrogenedentota bacterium]
MSVRRESWFLKIAVHVMLLAAVSAIVLPVLWTLSSAFKPSGEIFMYPPRIIPETPTLGNFTKLFKQVPMTTFFLNSAFISTSTTLLTLFFCSLAGFAFAKYRFRGDRILFLFGVMGALMVPFQVLLVPLFALMCKLHLIDTYWAVIAPGACGAFGVFLMRQFMVGVPNDLIDAARIDGCSEFGIYCRVALPLVKPALGALTIFTFLRSWNGFLWPMIVLSDDGKFTLPLGLAQLIGLYEKEYGVLMAGTIFAMLPIVVLFLVMQKEFVEGITIGALKE